MDKKEKLKIDDQAQTIKGMKIKDISAFAKINAFLFSPLYD